MPEFQLRRLGNRYRDGIHLNFATGVHYVKGLGAAPRRDLLTNLFTFTGGNQSLYRGQSGLLGQSATNTPRIEYDAGGTCLGLLMEASRTNIWTQSEDFTTTWTPSSITVTANQVAAPDGNTTADLLKEDGATSQKSVSNNVALSASTSYTMSVFGKAKERNWIYIQAQTPDGVFRTGWFNLSTGVAGTATSCTSGIQAYANGWYRCWITHTGGAGAGSPICRMGPTNADNVTSYTGDNTSGIYLWGAQIEAAAFPSSYIPTTTVAVTRTADSCTRTLGAEFSATAGSVIVQGRASGGQDAANGDHVYEFNDGTTGKRLRFFRAIASNSARVQVTDTTTQAIWDDTFTNLASFKHALAWTANDFAGTLNGAAPTTDSAGTIPAVTTLCIGMSSVGSDVGNCHIKTFDYDPIRRPNTYLVAAST